MLDDIKRRFREETFTRESIAQVVHAHPELVRMLYVNFAMVHYPKDEANRLMCVRLVFARDGVCGC